MGSSTVCLQEGGQNPTPVFFIVVVLACTVSSKGDVSGDYGRTGRYSGGNTPGIRGIDGKQGGRTPFGGTGSYRGGIDSISRKGQSGVLGKIGNYDMSPKPYSISYRVTGEEGGQQYKSESSDGSGSIKGNYGYLDRLGLYRQVEYVADENGFKTRIKTNEPGVGKESPADVEMIVEQTPAGIQEKYTSRTAKVSGKPDLGTFGDIYGIPGITGTSGKPTLGNFQGVPSKGISRAAVQPSPQRTSYGDVGPFGRAGQLSGSSGLFSGIPKSSSGKSTY